MPVFFLLFIGFAVGLYDYAIVPKRYGGVGFFESVFFFPALCVVGLFQWIEDIFKSTRWRTDLPYYILPFMLFCITKRKLIAITLYIIYVLSFLLLAWVGLKYVCRDMP